MLNIQHRCVCCTDLDSQTYTVAGKIMAYSIVHRGTLPAFLNEQLYVAIYDGYCKAQPDVSDVHDSTLRQKLINVSHSLH